jgi:L-amino acid N-acyltransferase YncA
MSIQYTQVATPSHIEQILRLQAENLASVLDAQTIAEQGFVTVQHDPEVLRQMNQRFPSVVALDQDRVVGYCLVMLQEFADKVPVLIPMFELLRTLEWAGKPLSAYRWFVMGQVCIAKTHRGQGIFDGLNRHLQQVCAPYFDCIVTEVALRNTRSLRAHERAGWALIHEYQDVNSAEWWRVIGLDCKPNSIVSF